MKQTAFGLLALLCVVLATTRTVLADETLVNEAMRQRGLVSAGDPAPFPGLTGEPGVGFEVVELQKQPVIDKDHPDCKDDKYGFEGGVVIKLNGIYHMFTAENPGDPKIARMRIAHWTSADALAWKRQATLFETTGEPMEVTGRAYTSIWQPTPVFNEAENRWDLFCVAYKVSGTGKGFIVRSQSTVPGREGLGGPYKELGVIMQPDKESQVWEGWQGVATFNPFQGSNGQWLAFYGSAAGHHPTGWLVGLASAPALSGPWTRLPQGNPVLIEPVFMENPVVTRIGDLYVMVYDSDILNPTKRSYFFENHSVGYATSTDGIHWSKGGRIIVQPKGEANWASDIRTPLGLVDEGHGLYTLVYTAEKRGGFKSVGMVKVKLVQKNNTAPVTTASMTQRGLVSWGDPARLQAVLAKARRGEPICVAAIGGSITAGGVATKDPKRRYVQQLAKWFEKMFPGLKVRFVNAGIGGTNSGYGALRVQRDVIAQQPDLVVVEYAVNDTMGTAKLDESYEGVLRQLLGSSTNRAVIELFFMHKDGNSAQPEQVVLGRHYGLPMISFRDAVWPELKAGTLKWETIYADVVHPNDAGHDIASELLRSFLDASLAKLPAKDADLPALTPMPAPLISTTFEHCTLFRAADLKPLSAAGWTCVKSNVWECSSAGGRLEYEVPGRS